MDLTRLRDAVVPAERTRRVIFAAASATALAVRLCIIFSFPDGEADAYGHWGAARALVGDPFNLAVHWVWLPGWHYALWASIHLGFSFRGIRIANAVLQSLAPLLLHAYVVARPREANRGRAHEVAWLSAVAWTLSPLPNVLATSAQAEVVFALLLLAAAFALEQGLFVLAGVFLSAACLLRYEAWGAVAAVGLQWIARRALAGSSAWALPAGVVAAWIVVRRVADGAWLVFALQTRAFVRPFRHLVGMAHLEDGLAFPFRASWSAMGPALALLPFGIGRSVRAGWVIPAGIVGFLFASYVGRGSLELDRYWTALVPFACVAIAEGALRLTEIVPRLPSLLPLGAALVALVAATRTHLLALVASTMAREDTLRRMELESQGETVPDASPRVARPADDP